MEEHISLTGEMFVALDACAQITGVNARTCEVLGYSEDELIGLDWFSNFIPSRIHSAIMEIAASLLKNDTPKSKRHVNPVLTRSGEERLVSWRNTVVRNDEGDIIGHESAGLDITDQLIAIEGFIESENKYKKLFDEAVEGIMVIEIETQRIRSANPAACSFYGYSEQEMTRLGVAQIHPAESLESTMSLFLEHVGGRRNLSRRLPCLRKDGRTVYADVKTRPVIFEGAQCLVGYLTNVTEQVAAEELSRKGEEKYHLLVETARHVIQDYDIFGTITYSNQACSDVYGYTPEEFVGRNIWDTFAGDPKELEEYLAYLVEKRPLPTPYVGEYVRKDGRKITSQVDWNYKYNDEGELIGFVSIQSDITERLITEKALSNSESQLRAILNSLRDVSVILYDYDGRVQSIWYDKFTDKKLGVCADDYVGKLVSEFLLPDQARLTLNSVQHVIDTKTKVYTEDPISLPGGNFWFDLTLSPLVEEDGSVSMAVGFMRDITARKQAECDLVSLNEELESMVSARTDMLLTTIHDLKAEVAHRMVLVEELRNSRERYRSFVENSSDWIWEKNLSLRHIYSNDQVKRILGFSPTEIMALDFVDCFHPDEQEENLMILNAHVSSKSGWSNWIKRVRHKDGSYRILESNSTPVLNENGELVGFMGVDRDITVRIRAEEELAEHQTTLEHVSRLSTMGATVSGLAHELNQPLSALSIYADACTRMIEPKMNADLTDTLSKIASQAERAGKIIHRVQQFTRKGERQTSTFDINQLIRESLGFFDSDANLTGMNIKLELSESIPQILGDHIQIQQVLLNLIRNAFDSMKKSSLDNRVLTIQSIIDEDGCVFIEVHDTGAGFDVSRKDDIFDSFYTTKEDGMGLGLSISRSIIEAHGGVLAATSEEDRGATFSISLPLEKGSLDAGQ